MCSVPRLLVTLLPAGHQINYHSVTALEFKGLLFNNCPKGQWLRGIIDSMHMSLSELREAVEDRGARRAAVHGPDTTQQLNNNNSKSQQKTLKA